MVALWLVKRRADGPTGQRRMTLVAVRTGPSGAITGWDPDTGEWIPYPTMLLRLTRHADIPCEEEAEPAENEEPGNSPRPWYPDFEEQRAITAQFIKPLLYSLRREQVLLMTHAQNSRGLWPFLVNGNLLRDSLQFGASLAQGIGLYGDGLRHVRMWSEAPRSTGDSRVDAAFAAMAEYLARRDGWQVPSWARLPEREAWPWWFVTDLRGLHPRALVESPSSFRRRGVFITSGALDRV